MKGIWNIALGVAIGMALHPVVMRVFWGKKESPSTEGDSSLNGYANAYGMQKSYEQLMAEGRRTHSVPIAGLQMGANGREREFELSI